MVHHVYYRAPFNPDGTKVLDIGTGTGIWAIPPLWDRLTIDNRSRTGRTMDPAPSMEDWVGR
ncbi:hypothetical protein ARAM_001760 [Aspergillus rambellii]|uniref:Uncharacterized protein n=1 Tax=Aspergillus rambellii TaxID=308745 RepID=A0A0F8UKS3_9EURO|nr:hypothetical protein ARAM_001760 [Aspergillus rambellii]